MESNYIGTPQQVLFSSVFDDVLHFITGLGIKAENGCAKSLEQFS